MASTAGGSTTAGQKSNQTRTGCGCLVLIIVVIAVIAAIAGGKSGSSVSTQTEAREYIKQKSAMINDGRVDYEHVAALVVLLGKSGGESETVVDELAKVAQEAHDELDNIRSELFKSGGNEKVSSATLELQEGANELKNAMGALVAYTGSPNPATLAHFTTQLEAAKGKWNEGANEIWHLANESGVMTLK
jgi:hypothetical protein